MAVPAATVALMALGVPPAPARAPDPDAVVFQAATGGGFVPESIRLGEIPEVTVYGDGRAIVVGPTPAISPPPALPNLQVFRIDDAGIDRLLARAAAAGIARKRPPNYGTPGVTDNPSTTVTVRVRNQEHSVSAYALTFGDDRLTDRQQSDRARLRRLIRYAGDEHAQRRYVVDDSQTYEPAAIDVHVSPIDTLPAPPGVPWPLGALVDGSNPARDAVTSCVTITGDDVETVLGAALRANERTVWEAAGIAYSLVFRPLLPNEQGCDEG